jgi:hypothetical protein
MIGNPASNVQHRGSNHQEITGKYLDVIGETWQA